MDDSTNVTDLKGSMEDIDNLPSELLAMETEEEEPDSNLNGMEIKRIKQEKPSEVSIDDNIIEVEIETEHTNEEGSPEVKETKPLATSTTTLKAIAPKPFVSTSKNTKTNLISSGGQQIVLLQSPGGTANAVSLATGQSIKLVSQTGQPVTLSQFQTSRSPTLIKSSDGNYIFRPVPAKTAVTTATTIMKPGTNIKQRIVPSAVQQKKIIVASGANTKPESGGQVVKIITSSANTLTSPTKTISFEQAKEMGLLSQSQIQQLMPQAVGKQIILNKGQVKPQLIKVASNQVTKSPAKILPAPRQKVIIKQGGQVKTGIINAAPQLLRIPAGQLNSAAGQIHQISIPGQAVQYVRLLNATPSSVSTAATTASANVASLVRSTTVAAGTTTTTTTSQIQTQPKLSTVVPVALINRGTNSSSVIKVLPMNTSNQTPIRPVAPKTTTTQRILVPSTATSTAKITVPTTVTSIQGAALIPTNAVSQSIVMVPTQYVQLSPDVNRSSIPKTTIKMESIKREIVTSPEPTQRNSSVSGVDSNGLRPRKPCNCTKSQCLKLYCDCFANGEFCNMCNCVHCFNNLENEENRQQAIRNCLERNPSAFRPKIGKGKDIGDQAVRRHTKGCNCKRSGCLKNYCECYEAKIACSNNCKCFGCRNIEESLEKKTLRPIAPMFNFDILEQLGIKTPSKISTVPPSKNLIGTSTQPDVNYRPVIGNNTKQPFAFMTTEVIEATVQCLLASAELAVRNDLPSPRAEKQVLEEFGRCLVEIIQTAHNESGESAS